MEIDEIREIADEAKMVVQDHCARLMKTISKFGYRGDQKIAFLQVALSQLLGGSLDLWLETHGGDAENAGPLCFCPYRCKKTSRSGCIKARFALTCTWYLRRILI